MVDARPQYVRSMGIIAILVLVVLGTPLLSSCSRSFDGAGAPQSAPMEGAATPSAEMDASMPAQDQAIHGSYASPEGYEDGAEAKRSSVGGYSPDGVQMMVHTKSMLVRVEDVEKTVEAARAQAATHGGSIESLTIADDSTGPVYSQSAGSDGRPLSGYVTFRIPVARYESFVGQVSKLGKVLRHSEGATDVTQQHVDLKARLQNLRAEEDRLREMFDRATKVSDMLDVERELSRVRGEAEAMQAQIQSLEKQVALATITLELVEPEDIVSPQGVDWGVTDALTEGLRQFVATFNGMIVAVMAIAPVVILMTLLALVVRALVRRRRRVRGVADDATVSGDAEA